MNKHLSTYYADPPNEGQYCEVHFDFKEDFPNKSLRYVEDAAENWALGIKKLN